MTKRKKQFFPKPTNKRPATVGSPESLVRPNLATINLEAAAGKQGLSVGDRVVIQSDGLYSGETVTIERLTTGAIPSAVVRTESGATRHVRTIDLAPAARENAAKA